MSLQILDLQRLASLRMGSESIAIDSEAMSARGIIVLVKSNELVKNIANKKNEQVKGRL